MEAVWTAEVKLIVGDRKKGQLSDTRSAKIYAYARTGKHLEVIKKVQCLPNAQLYFSHLNPYKFILLFPQIFSCYWRDAPY
jgi:hypothetical protein